MKKAYEQSPAVMKKWLEEEYPVIAACAKVSDAEIHWGDETGLRSDDVRARSYAPKGETPVIRVNNKRHGLSVISTVTNNSDILIDFMRRLIKDAGRQDLSGPGPRRVHHSKPAKAWLAEHKHEIEVFYLSSYSLGLNPNADLKQAVKKRASARRKLQLVKAAARNLSSLLRKPERIRSYFEHKLVRHAA
ncbi:UNVERIFIED_ORG: transposase [Variovorax guangxiensis]